MKNVLIILGVLIILYLLRNRIDVQLIAPGQNPNGSVKPVNASATGISQGSIPVTQPAPQTVVFYNGNFGSSDISASYGDVPEGSVLVL